MIKSSVATIMARIAALPKDSDTFIFGGGGEPTRYPQLSVIVRYVKERGFRKISLLTHALKLGNASYCEELFSAGVNSIHMIVPAVTSAISRKINAQPIWEKQKQALDTLWHMRTRTFLTFLCELSRQNQDQLIKIITTYKKYNPDEIIIVYTLDPTSLAQFGTLPTLQTIEDMITDQPTTIMVLRHFPFCMIDNKYWRYIQITNRTVKPPRAASCSRCRYEHQCEFPAYHYNQRYPIDLKPIINKR